MTGAQPVAGLSDQESWALLSRITLGRLRFIRIQPSEISGRRFAFGTEPDFAFDLG
jgi:hypothetical protein